MDENSFLIDDATDLYGVRTGRLSLNVTSLERESSIRPLPAIVPASDLILDASLTLPEELVKGVLHKGTKGVLASSSKAGKSWMLLDLALSVANGMNWLRWETTGGKVLVVNFEIPNVFIRERLRLLMNKKPGSNTGNLYIWNLRGHTSSFKTLLPRMTEEIKSKGYSLVILDPIYKGLAGSDESSAGDISSFCNQIEELCVETGAAIVYAHHFSKGNQGNKDVLDRLSGSGVFTRDADTIICFTKHNAGDDCLTVELVVRNLPAVESFVVQQEFPLMMERPDLDPGQLKGKGGRVKTFSQEDALKLLPEEGLSTTAWQGMAVSEYEISRSTFKRIRKELENTGKIEHVPNTQLWRVKQTEERKAQNGFPK